MIKHSLYFASLSEIQDFGFVLSCICLLLNHGGAHVIWQAEGFSFGETTQIEFDVILNEA